MLYSYLLAAMPLRGSASCSAFDVSTRKVPSLALVPRGHLKHAARAKKKVAGSLQPDPRDNDHVKQREEEARRNHHTYNDVVERKQSLPSLSPPRPTRRRTLSDTLDEEAEEEKEKAAAGRQKDPQQIKEDEEEEQEEEEDAFDADDGQAELRLGERFLNVMALMARLSTQSLGRPCPIVSESESTCPNQHGAVDQPRPVQYTRVLCSCSYCTTAAVSFTANSIAIPR